MAGPGGGAGARLGPPRVAERLPILLVPTGALLWRLPAAVDVWLDIGDGYELKPSVSEPSRFESDVVILDPSTRNPGLLSLEKAKRPRGSVNRDLHVSPCLLHQGSGVALDLGAPSCHLFGGRGEGRVWGGCVGQPVSELIAMPGCVFG